MPSRSKHDPSRPAIAVLGTGRMGAPIARNLLTAGFEVSVWNRTAERAVPLAADGARVSSSPAGAAEGAEAGSRLSIDRHSHSHRVEESAMEAIPRVSEAVQRLKGVFRETPSTRLTLADATRSMTR